MPQQIDRCASCAAPIFDVDDVEGACSCGDGIFQALLTRQRLANRRGMTRTASTATDHALVALARQGTPEPPALDPMMFMSPTACREMEAAQYMQLHPRPAPGPGRGRPNTMYDDVDDSTSMFSTLSLDDAPQSDGFDFEFSNGDDIEIPDGPRPSSRERFRVDRPPVREPFVATRAAGPQAGPMREVGRVGRFALLREDDPPPPVDRRVDIYANGDLVSSLLNGSPREYDRTRERQEAAKLNAQQQEKRAALHATLPTAYERVASGDFLSDADDYD